MSFFNAWFHDFDFSDFSFPFPPTTSSSGHHHRSPPDWDSAVTPFPQDRHRTRHRARSEHPSQPTSNYRQFYPPHDPDLINTSQLDGMPYVVGGGSKKKLSWSRRIEQEALRKASAYNAGSKGNKGLRDRSRRGGGLVSFGDLVGGGAAGTSAGLSRTPAAAAQRWDAAMKSEKGRAAERLKVEEVEKLAKKRRRAAEVAREKAEKERVRMERLERERERRSRRTKGEQRREGKERERREMADREKEEREDEVRKKAERVREARDRKAPSAPSPSASKSTVANLVFRDAKHKPKPSQSQSSVSKASSQPSPSSRHSAAAVAAEEARAAHQREERVKEETAAALGKGAAGWDWSVVEGKTTGKGSAKGKGKGREKR